MSRNAVKSVVKSVMHGCAKATLVLSLLLVSANAWAEDEAPATPGGSTTIAEGEGWFFHVDALMDIMRVVDSSSTVQVKFMPQVSAQYFLTKRFGLGLTTSYVSRSISTNTISSASFVDIMFGVVGRRVGDLFSEESVTFWSIGPFLAVPVSDFTVPITILGGGAPSNASKTYYGLSVVSTTSYPITDTFGLGPGFSLRMAFADPLPNSPSSFWFWDICIGLSATF